jgi:hypothetical protein
LVQVIFAITGFFVRIKFKITVNPIAHGIANIIGTYGPPSNPDGAPDISAGHWKRLSSLLAPSNIMGSSFVLPETGILNPGFDPVVSFTGLVTSDQKNPGNNHSKKS